MPSLATGESLCSGSQFSSRSRDNGPKCSRCARAQATLKPAIKSPLFAARLAL